MVLLAIIWAYSDGYRLIAERRSGFATRFLTMRMIFVEDIPLAPLANSCNIDLDNFLANTPSNLEGRAFFVVIGSRGLSGVLNENSGMVRDIHCLV
jgi:hypothetical protein